MKHAILLRILDAMAKGGPPFTVIDTHAGAGVYDLAGDGARRTRESDTGIGALLANLSPPPIFQDLLAAVHRLNPGGATRLYPGSPVLIASVLRQGDRLIACEARADDAETLRRALSGCPAAEVLNADGWEAGVERVSSGRGAYLVLIDPPFERGDEAANITRAVHRLLSSQPKATIAIWAPIKDLASFDALLGQVEDAAPKAALLVAEVRLRPLTDPMALNGCALLLLNPPLDMQGPATAVANAVARLCGGPGALGTAYFPGSPTGQSR
jgi:23S rRNA (adenine2030-N6)-methyltransferase